MTQTNRVQHCVIFTWRPNTPPEAIDRLAAGLAELRDTLDLTEYAFGQDLGIAEGNADFAVLATFASYQQWQNYMQHPLHQNLIAHVLPFLEAKSACQFPITTSA